MNTNETQPSVNPWTIAVSVMLATFMEVLDTSIANVSLRHIAGSLSVSTDESTWVLTTYLISNAIVIPTTAWFGQKFGRKRFLMTCVAIFTAASFLCGVATSLPMLLAMRVLQGAGGGALQPIAQSILLESFPKEKHGTAMGVYGLGVVTAPILGPVLGGWITDNYSWRWIFFINVPVGIFALMLMQRFIHDPHWIRNARPARLDVIGFSFMSLWLGCQEVLLDKGQEDDWFGSHFIVIMAALAVAGFIAFIWRVSRTEKPFVDLSVLKNYNFSLGLGLMFFAGLSLYSLTALIPLFLQSLMGYTALQSGYAMIPRGLGALVAMPLAGRLVTKIQGRYLVAGGFLSFGGASFVLAHLSLDLSIWVLFWPLFFSGVAIAFMFVPLNTIALGSLKPEQIGNASGIFNLMRNVGGSVGISLVTTFVARSAQAHQTILAAHLTPYDTTYQSTLQTMTSSFAAHGNAAAHQLAVGSMYHTLLRQANLLAYLDNFRWFALLCSVCILGALLLRKVKVHAPVAAH
ncbi:MAG TPA: DHA2 family efflux MFS transporter permease subunit [Verrucomicrobiae bacterium]|nr:DHA2 family efflux MFS transporter permease subunit [Verrucomicrobiae bacterium]